MRANRPIPHGLSQTCEPLLIRSDPSSVRTTTRQHQTFRARSKSPGPGRRHRLPSLPAAPEQPRCRNSVTAVDRPARRRVRCGGRLGLPCPEPPQTGQRTADPNRVGSVEGEHRRTGTGGDRDQHQPTVSQLGPPPPQVGHVGGEADGSDPRVEPGQHDVQATAHRGRTDPLRLPSNELVTGPPDRLELPPHSVQHPRAAVAVDACVGSFPLGQWISEQRRAYRAGTLAAWRVELLEEAGMVWSVPDAAFEENLAAARAYFAVHGTLCAPRPAVMAEDRPTGQSLTNCRRPEGLGKDPQRAVERAARLAVIDPNWSPAEKGWTVDWQRQYAKVRACIDGSATLAEIRPGVTVGGEDVGLWLARQRTEWKQLADGQRERLTALGIQSTTPALGDQGGLADQAVSCPPAPAPGTAASPHSANTRRGKDTCGCPASGSRPSVTRPGTSTPSDSASGSATNVNDNPDSPTSEPKH
ncbi:hypothetical protein F0L17_26565 [Streptomyces sp. TRM43335]|uniref:Helicase-associated domain-containing protein n=1 Tax=Streptomyces taklimakanensis TaxID=2569853 RepID=A0A6G2BK56_9ACTN|nr:helicase associated domain-containing protein [Streptomyces taklimakanensis]MTE22594.1 hypothetical protein [Streptomyces taklimakanensis]